MGAVCGRPAAEPSSPPASGGQSKEPPSKPGDSAPPAAQPAGGGPLAPLKVLDLRQGESQPREGGGGGGSSATQAEGASREAASSVAASAAQQSAQQLPVVSEAEEPLESPKSHPIKEEEEAEDVPVEVSRPPGGAFKSTSEARPTL